MKFDKDKAQQWLHYLEHSLPGIESILSLSKSPVLILGAGVLELFSEMNWIAPLRRGPTGDLDLSVGLVNSATEYETFVNEFKARKFRHDADHPYRWHSPIEIPGAMRYVDILSHPATDAVSESAARKMMGVDSEFSLSGMNYTMMSGYKLGPTIIIPTFIGILALKLYAYSNSPDKRRKDFADVIEICWSLVERSNHYDLTAEWAKVAHHPESIFLKSALEKSASGNSSEWDLEDIRNELLRRKFTAGEIDDDIKRRLLEIVAVFCDESAG